jgi:hypothetical protein
MMSFLDQEYRETSARVRALDPDVQIGMASSHEVARLKGIADRLEGQKAARAPSPSEILGRTLNDHWRAFHIAYQEIIDLQATMNRDLRSYRDITPPSYFEAPEPIESIQPSFIGTDRAAQITAFIAQFAPRAAALKARAQAIASHVREWERLSPNDRILRLVRGLGMRVEQLEAAKAADAERKGGRHGKR